MTDRILIACPHCQHELRVRSEYAGRMIACNYCRKTFEARLPGVPAAADTGHAESATRPEKAPRTPGATAQELARAKAKITQLRGQRQALAEEVLKAKNILGPLRHRVKDLEDQLDQAQMQTLLVEEEVRAAAPGLAELDRLRVEVASLGPRAADAVRLEERLAEAGHENDRLRGELEEARASLAPSAPVPASDAHAEEIARLERERDEAARQRDRLETELESVRTGFKEARDEINRMGLGFGEIAAESTRLEEERAAVSRMRDELQAVIDEQRRALAEREAELTEVLERLDLERAGLESRGGQDESRIASEFAEARARYEETIRSLEAELERNASARGEVGSLRDRLAAAGTSIENLQSDRDRVAALHEQAQQRASQAELRLQAETDRLLGERSEAQSQLEVKSRLIADLTRRMNSLQVQNAQAPRTPAMNGGLPGRPEPMQDEESAAFRTRLQHWLEQATLELTSTTARVDALGADVKAVREELDVLNTDLALGAWDEDEEEIAFPFEES